MPATEQHRRDGDTYLRAPAATQQLALRMLRRDVGNFVTNDCRELMLVLCRFQDAFVDDDLAAGHDECVDLVGLDDRHLPVVVAVRRLEDLDDGVGDTRDIGDRLPVGRQGG